MSKNVSTRKIGAFILLSAPVILLLMILLRSLTISAAEGDVSVDANHFPDEAFRTYLSENFDTDGDGVITSQEIENITCIDVFDRGISSLEGIGYFTALEKLIVNGNTVSGLDLSNNARLLRKLRRCDLVENYVIPGQGGQDENVEPSVENETTEVPPVIENEVTEPEVTEPEVTETENKTTVTTDTEADAVIESSDAVVEETEEGTGEETEEEADAPKEAAAPRTCTAYIDSEGNVVLAVDPGVVITPAIEKSETDAEIYTVTFMDGEEVLKTVEVEDGDTLEEYKPEKEELVFAGWYKESGLVVKYDFSAPVTEDLTLYAKWREEGFLVTFMDDEKVLATVLVAEGEPVEEPTLDILGVDMMYAGWFTDKELTEEYDFSEPVTDDLTLYGKELAVGAGNVYNVTDFGAKAGDGKDDLAAFNKALKKATETDDVIEVRVPAGTFDISGSLSIYSNTHLICDKNTVIKSNASGDLVTMATGNPGSDSGKGGYGQLTNIEISGGTWNRNSGEKTVAGAFVFFHGNNIHIHDLTITNCTDHIINVSADQYVLIENVTFKNHIAYTGTNPDFWGGHAVGDKARYEFVEAVHTDTAGSSETGATPLDNTVADNIIVRGCNFDGVLTGVGNHHNSSYKTSSVVVEGCTFNLKYGCAVNAWSFTNLQFTNNIVNAPTTAAIFNQGHGTLYKNTFTISGTNPKDACILMENGSDVTAQDNTINTNQNMLKGMVCLGSTLKAYGNVITNVGNNGIYLRDSSNFTLYGNVVTNARYCSFFIINCSGTNTVESNAVFQTGSDTYATINLEDTSGNTTIKGNDFSGKNGDSAILVSRATATLLNNKITSPGANALRAVNGSNITARGNIITGCNFAGLRVEGGSAVMSGNDISNSGYYGIYLNNDSSVTLDGNKVKNSGTAGIYVGGCASAVTVQNNTVSGTYEAYGIQIEAAKGKTDLSEGYYERNGNSYNGYNYLAANTVTVGSDAGILIKDCTAIVLGNSVTGVSGDALETRSGPVEVKYSKMQTASGSNYDVRLTGNSGLCRMIENTYGSRGVTASDGSSWQELFDFSTATISGFEERKAYMGSPVKQNLVIQKASRTLTENRDYTLTYKNNSGIGQATLTIKGIGSYTGSFTKQFYIVEQGSICLIFDDCIPGAWYIKAVQYSYDNGIMAGKKPGQFDPNGNITRNEFTQILYNMEGKPAVSIANPFSDVDVNKWYAKSVLWAYSKGITSGKPDGTFGVDQKISRQDIAVMLYKYAQIKGYKTNYDSTAINGYKDTKDVSGYAKTAMNWAITQGILSGKGKAGDPKSKLSLAPVGNATRAECSSMIMKLRQANK